MLEEIWDAIVDGFSYIISFEWLGDVWEFLGSMFEGISEFSIYGIVFGLIGFGTVFIARDYMLGPFLIHMSPSSKIFWAGATYVASFIGGYLIGNHFQNT